MLIATLQDQYQWAIVWLSGLDGQMASGFSSLHDVWQTVHSQTLPFLLFLFVSLAQESGQHDETVHSFEPYWGGGHLSEQSVDCASALQLGQIYQVQGANEATRIWFVRCLETDPNRCRDGVYQKAKVSLVKVDR